jgi:hypothetical protein
MKLPSWLTICEHMKDSKIDLGIWVSEDADLPCDILKLAKSLGEQVARGIDRSNVFELMPLQ